METQKQRDTFVITIALKVVYTCTWFGDQIFSLLSNIYLNTGRQIF